MVRAHLLNFNDLNDELTIMEWTEGRLTKGRYKIIYGEMLDWADDSKRRHLQMIVSVDGLASLLFDLITVPGTGKAVLLCHPKMLSDFTVTGRLLKVFDIRK